MIGLYVAVRTFIAWLWLRFCRWCAQPLRLVLKSNEYYHKIVIIGDGFAAGFGDWITMASSGGLSEYIAHEISKEDKIRHKWQVINRGIVDTDSSQWHPTSSTKYFQSVMSTPQLRDADVVLVVVGSMDARYPKTSLFRLWSFVMMTILDARPLPFPPTRRSATSKPSATHCARKASACASDRFATRTS
ncbi:hypothetical protein, variant 3 [Aphanomyces astaci]|uniref:SGNH hydrolase-type esterase domain-containing protein n=1 Tax=Aphanomyces astaci TaxID=112090 RepID=W4FX04_APHAT|nr:hypothetical protein, variant 2 [Aphanomyces astaci]XP_009839419.1 hypothetical protein, variant 3 [Aphanomyces astaci]ETV71172.1 hypothetical protein, variant 2 [Aphanomyces astaci]ETV71173.1 hypothetical protein, variant 3 [Aphanomyces astaci]|eukprot:XP_009839416.1 hypothetical protein, variant 2 [Aphanomyces astaci]